jgi:signal transduction histidine kinase
MAGLGRRLEVRSRPGEGSTFTLPLAGTVPAQAEEAPVHR